MSEMSDPADDVMQKMRARLPEGMNLKVPPNVFEDMEAQVVSFAGTELKVRMPVKERYQNPMGHMQGGIIVAAIDNCMGPLSYLVAPPSVTSSLSTTYIRPVTPKDAYIEVRAWVVERTARQLIMDAEVTNPAGKRIAVAHAIAVIVAE